MNFSDAYQRIDIPRERAREMFTIAGWAFASDMPEDEIPILESALDWSRARGTTPANGPEAGELSSVHSSYGYVMRTPGGTIRTSGLTWVAVHPAHRRRGLLTTMIADHFERSLARGEAVSTLIAAETEIYQRFGYGIGHHAYQVTLPRGLRLPAIAGADGLRLRLEFADPARHGADVRAVLARDLRPGSMAELDDILMFDVLKDAPSERRDSEPLRIAVVEDAEGPAAFAVFRRSLPWEGRNPDGKGHVQAWAAATLAAERRMFSALADLDLMASLTVKVVATDDPLLHWAPDLRALDGQLRDQLWVRILDLPTALESRTYARNLDRVVAVTDAQVPANARSWRIAIDNGQARVTAADADVAADVTLDIRQLSSAYLGGVRLDVLAAAGLIVEHGAGAVRELSDAFASAVAPRSTFFF